MKSENTHGWLPCDNGISDRGGLLPHGSSPDDPHIRLAGPEVRLGPPSEVETGFRLGPSELAMPHGTKMIICCAGCGRPIMDKFLLTVLDRTWHTSCVRCHDCGQTLHEKCFSRDNKLFCRPDFFR